MAATPRTTGSPAFILSDDASRTRGRDAQFWNITAGKAVAEAVRTTLGPRGMDKLLVDATGNVVITNDGVTILEEMDVDHPAARMLVEVARTQEDEVGDGTTTAAVLAGQLLARAGSLLEDDVHPSAIVEGYAAARDLALDAVADAAVGGDLDDDRLRDVARSSMTGKGTGDVSADALADLVVRAVRQVTTDDGVARDDVRVHAQVGASSGATALVDGVVLDSDPVRDDAPRSVADADVLVFDAKLGAREANADVAYDVTSVDQLTAAMDAQTEERRELAAAVADAGADVVFCSKDVDDAVAAALAKRGVLVYDSLSGDDLRAVAAATGAAPARDATDLQPDDLGYADAVRVEAFGGDSLTFVEAADADSVTLFVRGGTEHVVTELERALGDALDVVAAAIDGDGVVPGAGCVELRAADAVRDGAARVDGRAQLAAEAFADALDVLPRTLAANAGLDPIDALAALRAGNESGRAGVLVDGDDARVGDPVPAGVYDPAAVKQSALEAATEAATMIVRIDDVIAAE
ncbi:MAG: thermosome subunit alpha [Halobacterium sp.]